MSEGQPHARKILRRVQARCADPMKAPEYFRMYGPFYRNGQEKQGKPWSADYFSVARADGEERDYTMEARGWRSAIAGTRTDLMIIDDIQSMRSLNLTESMVETVRQDFLTRPGREGRVIIVGTRVGVGDFYDQLWDQGVIDNRIVLPALDQEGRSLCPEMWPEEALARKRRQVGESTWYRNYMQQPQRSGAETFPRTLLEGCRDFGRTRGQSRETTARVAGLDPALAGGNAIVVAGYSAEKFEILDVARDFNVASVEAILGIVDRLAVQHRFETLVVESNAFQRGLVHDERLRRMGAERGFVVKSHQTHLNKLDDAIGVARMPSTLVTGEMSFPYADEDATAVTELLFSELEVWRADVPTRQLRQDMVMALWFAWLHWREQVEWIKVKDVKIKRRGLPWTPTANLIRAGARRGA